MAVPPPSSYIASTASRAERIPWLAARRRAAFCSAGTSPDAVALSHASPTASSIRARAERTFASAPATAAWVSPRSARVRVEPAGFFAVASSVRSSIAARAMPSPTAEIDSASRPKTGKA